jgi:hypothetical protein
MRPQPPNDPAVTRNRRTVQTPSRSHSHRSVVDLRVIGDLATGFEVPAHSPATDDCAEQIARHASIEILSAFDRYQDSPELVLGKRERATPSIPLSPTCFWFGPAPMSDTAKRSNSNGDRAKSARAPATSVGRSGFLFRHNVRFGEASVV